MIWQRRLATGSQQAYVSSSESVIEEKPAIAAVIVLAVAAVAWVGISLLMRNTVNPIETGLFAVVFVVVYFGFAYVTDAK